MLKSCEKRDTAHNRMITFPIDESKRKFKQLRNETKKQIAIEKRKFYDNELGNSNDSKKCFKFFISFVEKRKLVQIR